jgi:hypothetical protein
VAVHPAPDPIVTLGFFIICVACGNNIDGSIAEAGWSKA